MTPAMAADGRCGVVKNEQTTPSLAELVSTLSVASDLGMGRPVERVLRQTVIAMRLADAAGVDPAVRAATYYTSLLTWVGCATDTSDLTVLFGEEEALFADTHDGDLTRVAMGVFVARHLGRGGPALRRVGMVGRFVGTAGRSVQKVMEAHCQAAGEFADRLGLGAEVRTPLVQAFERWDGQGVPGKVGSEQLAVASRLVHLADNVEAFHHAGGSEAAIAVARERRGTQFDPALVDCFCDNAAQLLDGIGELSAWEEVIALDPSLGAPMDPALFDEALATFGDFADLKDPTRTGHSRSVASLAGGAALLLGLPTAEVENLRRAGWVHDVGVIGVSSTVWTEPGPWSLAQRERARAHPYLTERMLARSPALRRIGQCAALHHERLDGSGYPKGLTASSLPVQRSHLGSGRRLQRASSTSATPTGRRGRRSRAHSSERGGGGASGRRCSQRRADHRRASGPTTRGAARWAHPARGRGRGAARSRAVEPGDREGARRVAANRDLAPRARVHEVGRRRAHRSRLVRHAPWPRGRLRRRLTDALRSSTGSSVS